MLFGYEVIPVAKQQPIDKGNINADDLKGAIKAAQTIPMPSVADKGPFYVRVLDGTGKEAWRGPYLGTR